MIAELVRVCQTCGTHVTDLLAFHWRQRFVSVPPEHARVTCVVCYRAACGACARAWLLGVCGACP